MRPILENEKLTGIIGVGTNITDKNSNKKKIEELRTKLTEAYRINSIERDRAQQQINILSELNTLKNEFISNVSHELRTPLASIIGFSETIAEDKKLTIDKVKEFNEIILTESKRLAKLINDVLDFSELENEKKQLSKNSVDIIKLLNQNLAELKEKYEAKQIVLTSKLPESEVIIYADKERINKAINYLLSNAVKFTKNNGRITVQVKEFLKEIEIIISDTGIGIPKENIPFLFDKFSKINKKGHKLPGAGFGLITVKQIIDLHKGLIRVKSEINKGTSFIIKLPKYKFE
jgi:two-component system phosphate regulon sensor histidine kinase PhoR